MLIENVLLEDLDDIFNLEKTNFNKDAFSKEVLRSLIVRNTLFLKIINEQKQIIGFVIALQDSMDRINIINFLIDKQYQSQGYGNFLLEFTLDKIKSIKYIKKIILNVNTNNKTALNLYTKFNFVITEKVENYYRYNENAYLMELEI
jgi:ribosomal protein S18 acetylase RimI-like enzyme